MGTNEHNCDTEKCTGEQLGGIYFTCNKCENKYFLQCLIYETDVLKLLETIELLKYNKINKKYETNKTETTLDTFHTIFGTSTSFEYICKKCLKEGRTTLKIKTLEKTIKRQLNEMKLIKQQNNEACDKINELQKRNEELNQTINTNRKLIQELTEQVEEPQYIIENNTIDKTNEINIKNINEKTIQTIIMKEMEKITKQIDEKITNECKKLKYENLKYLTPNEERNNNNNRRYERQCNITPRRNVTFTTKTTHLMNKNTKNNETCHRDLSNEDEQEREEQNMITKFNTKLKPAKQTQHTTNEKYEIYVAKFEYGTEKEWIEQHIMDNTTILSNDAFKIEEIVSKRNLNRPNYVAFKITALKYEIYKQIMNIWTPHFTARDFIQSKYERIQEQGAQKRYQGDITHKEYRYETEKFKYRTPKKKMEYGKYIKENQQNHYTPNRYKTRERYERQQTPKQRDYEREKYETHTNKQMLYNYQYHPFYPIQHQQQQQQIPIPIHFLGQLNQAPPPIRVMGQHNQTQNQQTTQQQGERTTIN